MVIKWIVLIKVNKRKLKKKEKLEKKNTIFGCCNIKAFSLLDSGYLGFSEKRQDPSKNKLKHKR